MPILQPLCEVRMQSCDTVAKHPIPQLTICRGIIPKDNRVTTLYTPWSKPSVTVDRNLYAHACNHLRMLTVSN